MGTSHYQPPDTGCCYATDRPGNCSVIEWRNSLQSYENSIVFEVRSLLHMLVMFT